MRRDNTESKERPKGVFPDIHAGKKLDPCFSKELRAALTKARKFRHKETGKLSTHTYVELLVQKIMDELLHSPTMDVKLLEMVVNRLEGKIPEGLDLSGGFEVREGFSAKELLLQKLGRHSRLSDAEKSDR